MPNNKFVKQINEDGSVIYKQPSMDDVYFENRFGAKAHSTTQNTIGTGSSINFVLDSEATKFVVGDDIQCVATGTPDCFMYGSLLTKDTTYEPAYLTLIVNETSPLTGVFNSWDLQVVKRLSQSVVVRISYLTSSVGGSAVSEYAIGEGETITKYSIIVEGI